SAAMAQALGSRVPVAARTPHGGAANVRCGDRFAVRPRADRRRDADRPSESEVQPASAPDRGAVPLRSDQTPAVPPACDRLRRFGAIREGSSETSLFFMYALRSALKPLRYARDDSMRVQKRQREFSSRAVALVQERGAWKQVFSDNLQALPQTRTRA